MASGLGLKGNVSRCFYIFEDFSKCMKMDELPLVNCRALRNDYLECLHHRREAEQYRAVLLELERQEKAAKDPHAGAGGGGGHH